MADNRVDEAVDIVAHDLIAHAFALIRGRRKYPRLNEDDFHAVRARAHRVVEDLRPEAEERYCEVIAKRLDQGVLPIGEASS